MQPVAIALSVNESAHVHLRLCPLAGNAPHVFGTPYRGEPVSHGRPFRQLDRAGDRRCRAAAFPPSWWT
jgi:hypothetical protein